MSAWPGKAIIGLTGNIATGKSVVRKMLEHLGAYGIDADALGHRAIAKGAPGYTPVVNTFGKWIVGSDGQIDRSRLARVVFADADALASLEQIVHPLVRQAVDILVRRSTQPVVVIEAIKLLEGPLRQACDSIWVCTAPPELQVARLVQKRGMTEQAARQRIDFQTSQELKKAAADVVIRNQGSFEDTWRQVTAAWKEQFPAVEIPGAARPAPRGALVVEKARPHHAAEIAALITRLSEGERILSRSDVMAAFGEKAFMFLKTNGKAVGLVGWQVENLVARIDDVYLEPDLPIDSAMPALMSEVEKTSRDLQCEAALLFLRPELSSHPEMWKKLGYEPRQVSELGARAWQEAAQESLSSDEMMFFKQLRRDRVLRPV